MKVREATGLPSDIAASLGRMISRFSLLEAILARILYQLVGVDPKRGRVAVGAPRVGDYPKRMQQLAEVIGIDLSPFPWNAYKKTLDNLKEQRDVFAHSVWLVDVETKKYLIQDTSGNWPAPPNTKPLSRKIVPEGRNVTPSDLRKLRADVDKAIQEAKALARFVRYSLQVHATRLGAASPQDHPRPQSQTHSKH